MSLDALLARLEARTVTPVTDAPSYDVTEKPKKILGYTAVTPVTAEGIICTPKSLTEEEQQDYYEETSAIAQYDGGLSPTDAKAQAVIELQELQTQRNYH